MDAEYARLYADLYRHHWWWRAREHAVLELVRRVCADRGPTRILDIGCGDGLLFDALSAFGAVDGVEPDTRLLTSESKYSSAIVNAPFDDSFSSPHRYGLILFLDVLEHMRDPVMAVRHALRLLEPDGAVIVTVPAFQWLWTSHDDLNHHYMRFSRKDLTRLASAAGADIKMDRYLFQWLVPAKLLVRVGERIRRRAPSLPKVPPRGINELLFRYSRLEHRVAGAVNAPYGSSLMAVLSAQS